MKCPLNVNEVNSKFQVVIWTERRHPVSESESAMAGDVDKDLKKQPEREKNGKKLGG